MKVVGNDDKVGLIVEQVFELHALIRGAVRTGEHLMDDPKIGKLGLEFMAVMSILNQVDERFADLTEQLGFDQAA